MDTAAPLLTPRTTAPEDYRVPGKPRGRLSWLIRDILRRSFSLIVLPMQLMATYSAQLILPPLIAFSVFLALGYVLIRPEQVPSFIEIPMSMIGIAGQTLPGASVWWCTLIGFGCRKMDSTSQNSESLSNVTLSSVKIEVQSASKVIGGMQSLPDMAARLNANFVQHCSRSHLMLGNYELVGRSGTP
jgi:hypothetical protein